MEWEYRALVIGAEGQNNLAELNRFGAEGWEISVFIDPVLIFKRLKPIIMNVAGLSHAEENRLKS